MRLVATFALAQASCLVLPADRIDAAVTRQVAPCEQLTDIRHHKGARFHVLGCGADCLDDYFLYAIFAPITIPISALITGIDVAASGSWTEHRELYACP